MTPEQICEHIFSLLGKSHMRTAEILLERHPLDGRTADLLTDLLKAAKGGES